MTTPVSYFCPAPVFRAWDNSGAPLVAGLLYTYAAGTTTPIASYVDSTGVGTNTNPVVLNSRGECNLWLIPNTGYKLVLTDKNGTPIWTEDQIFLASSPTAVVGANPTAVVGLAAVNGSAVTFMRSDGSPALDQTISPTWTGVHIFGNTTVPTINDGSGAQFPVGFRSLPQNIQGSGYTLATADNGKSVTVTGNVNVPNAVFQGGAAMVVYNNSASQITLTPLAGLTMRLAGTATSVTNPSFLHLSQRGTATVYFNGASECIVGGAGVTT